MPIKEMKIEFISLSCFLVFALTQQQWWWEKKMPAKKNGWLYLKSEGFKKTLVDSCQEVVNILAKQNISTACGPVSVDLRVSRISAI